MNTKSTSCRRSFWPLLASGFLLLLVFARPGFSAAATDSLTHYLMIGHAHIDPVWRWPKEEGYQEVFATFRSALDRMKEYPDVCFVASSAQFYKWVLETDPVMFAEIKDRVKEGRWNVVGGWWVESDVNCPSGESLVRQGLYGQRFFKTQLGVYARVGFSPDTFGHPWTLPQILRQQDLQSYFFMRPGKHENADVPAPIFNWQGADGSRILTVQILGYYKAEADEIEKRVAGVDERFSRELPFVTDRMVFYGVGNHGGGPTRQVINKIIELEQGKYPTMRFATLDDYVRRISRWTDSFPVYNGELQHHARGCYSACADVKKWNRQAEAALISTEKLRSFITAKIGAAYPVEALRTAWEKVLFNQFHDILAGSSIEQAYVDAGSDYGMVRSQAKDLTIAAMQKLAMRVNTADPRFPDSVPFIVFNPCSFPVRTPLEIEMHRLIHYAAPVLRDEHGNPVDYQEIRTASVKEFMERLRVLFIADLPAMGYRLYRFDFDGKPAAAGSPGVKVGEWFLENSLVKVSFDPQTGYISSYFDKSKNRELVNKQSAVPVVLEDTDDTWGHKIIAYDKEIGRFGNPKFVRMEDGPERGRIQIEYTFGSSKLYQDFSLHRGSTILDCKVTTDWYEHKRVLKMAFATPLESGHLTYSIPYGFIERPQNGEEEPGQAWIDLSGSDAAGAYGIAVINNGVCGYSAQHGEMRMTLLHSTAWCHHNPQVVGDDDGYRFMEQGRHELDYQLVPHQGDWRQGQIARQSECFLMKPITHLTTNHSAKGPVSDSLFYVDASNASLSCVKMAEEGEALILRCVELNGESARGALHSTMGEESIPLNLQPCEIKTIRLPLKGKKQITEVNLLESPAR